MAPSTTMRVLRPDGPVEFSAGLFHCRFAGTSPWIDYATILDMGRGWHIVFKAEDYDAVTDVFTCRVLEQRHLPFDDSPSLGKARQA